MSSYSHAIYKGLVCRPALPLDTPGMILITRQIWEGDDYVPKVWSEWLFDPEGLLAIAEFKGKVVGFGKLTKLSQHDWWLEGLRVHPQFEGNRIASRLHQYLLELWVKTGSGTLRFATVSSREPVKHLAQVNGFQLVGEYSTFKSIPRNMEEIEKHKPPFTRVSTEQIPGVVEWLNPPAKDRLPNGLIDLGWQYAPPRKQYLANYVNEKQIWWWRQDQGVLIQVEKKDGAETWARIRMLACENKDLVDFLSDTHFLAARMGYAGVTWMAPLIPFIEETMAQAGYKRDWDSSLLIFERSIT